MFLGPSPRDFTADDGGEVAAHHGGAHVHVNDERADGDQRGADMQQ